VPELKISELFEISNRFLRSAHLERDFHDPNALNEYILSDFARNCLKRLAKGLENNSGQRAWRITGDYGSGKSSFALFLAHWFAGEVGNFPKPIKNLVDYKHYIDEGPRYLPILVTGSRLPLRDSLLKALYDCLSLIHTRGKKPKILLELEKAIQSKDQISDEQLINYIINSNRYIILSNKGTGSLIIIDELGKFLEFAAQYPEQQDVYLLQKLAEIASRSGQSPFFIIGLLHQGFNVYADQLSQTGQREWEKVAARFDELIFNQPIEQTSTLISSALKVRSTTLPKYHINNVKEDMAETIKLGWFGAAPAENELLKNSIKLYPLHPSVLPVLIRIFNRFGQNERSLFSFLLSNEPFGLQSYSEENFAKNGEYYRLNNLYDYVRFNFGYRLSVQNYRSHWNHIQSMIDSFATNSELELKALKTVGIINLINQNDLLATEESIKIALKDATYSSKEILNALEILHRKRHVLYHRGAAGGYCLWPHTSVDLDHSLDNAKKALGPPKNISRIVKEFIDPTPLVARRHYIQTGNLRHFDIYYCSVLDLPSIIKRVENNTDGAIIIPLCETKEERSEALSTTNHSILKKKPDILIAIPPQLNILAGLVLEAQKWKWVSRNTPELVGDRFAKEEVARQIDFSRSTLLKQINTFIGLRQFTGHMDLDWYQQGSSLSISSGRALLSKLSEICDIVYSKAPEIKNELVNRRSLSSAAAAARMRLIERMVSEPNKPFLGMDPNKKPPEMSAYLSILKQSNLHQLQDGIWCIALPNKEQDKCNVLPIFKKIKKILKSKPDNKISISYIYSELKKSPYGVREGIIPILLAAFKVIFEHEIAFYENGSFSRIMAGEEFQRLIKAPDTFEIQYCKIEGLRTNIFNKLSAALGLSKNSSQEPELLDIVQPLCVFAANLPNYVHNTKELTKEALAVRDAILSAHEPVKLLFYDLPKACGLKEFKTNENFDENAVQNFVTILKDSVNELKMAYPELNERLKKQILETFMSAESFPKFRNTVAERAEMIAINISEPKLKAFCLRLMDESLPEFEWVESIASYLVSKPPDKWKDNDESSFYQKLIENSSRFSRVESVLFSKEGKLENSIGMRFSLTRSDGNEKENVFYLSHDEEQKVKEIQKKVGTMIARHKHIGFAAAFRALWDNLPKNTEEKE